MKASDWWIGFEHGLIWASAEMMLGRAPDRAERSRMKLTLGTRMSTVAQVNDAARQGVIMADGARALVK